MELLAIFRDLNLEINRAGGKIIIRYRNARTKYGEDRTKYGEEGGDAMNPCLLLSINM